MIMNKISENNINELVGEYLSNILVDTEEKYNVIMTEIFNKMIKDIKFAEIYIKFAMKIFIIEIKLKINQFIAFILNVNHWYFIVDYWNLNFIAIWQNCF